MREKKVESELTNQVKKIGGWAIKFLPSVSGLPDRIVLLPGGRIFFVELKAPSGTVAAHQEVVHSRLRKLGFTVIVLASVESVQIWAEEQRAPQT